MKRQEELCHLHRSGSISKAFMELMDSYRSIKMHGIERTKIGHRRADVIQEGLETRMIPKNCHYDISDCYIFYCSEDCLPWNYPSSIDFIVFS